MEIDRAWHDLEGVARETVELLLRLRNENVSLREKIDKLNRELEELDIENQVKTGALEGLKSTVRSRVESILEKVSALEENAHQGHR